MNENGDMADSSVTETNSDAISNHSEQSQNHVNGAARNSPPPAMATSVSSVSLDHDKTKDSTSDKTSRIKKVQNVNRSKRSAGGSGRRSRGGSSGAVDAETSLTTTEEVLAMLENVDLTEAETDELLTDAYALNRRLRKQLEKQNVPAPLQRSQTLGAGGGSGGVGARYRGGGGRGDPLPPISHNQVRGSIMVDIYSAKPGSKMGRKNITVASVPERYMHHKPTSATVSKIMISILLLTQKYYNNYYLVIRSIFHRG